MNKSDKYYMKQGKLELSMLDSDEDDDILLQSYGKVEEKRDLFSDIEFQHTRKIRDKRENKSIRPQDIYSTLQSMGQFLVKGEEADIAKAQRLAKIGSTLKIEDMELPPKKEEKVVKELNKNNSLATNQKLEIQTQITQNNDLEYLQNTNKEKIIRDSRNIIRDTVEVENKSVSENKIVSHNKNIVPFNNESINTSNNSKDDLLERTIGTTDKDPHQIIRDIRNSNMQNNSVNHTDTKSKAEINLKNRTSEVIYSQDVENVDIPQDMDVELKQDQIDKILNLHFGRIRANYPDAKILKLYIDEQIDKIQNYGN